MRKMVGSALALVVCIAFAGFAWAQEDVEKFKACKFCGMDRAKYAHSRVLIDYDNNTAEGTCSIHCAAVDLSLNIDKTPATIWVGDYNTKKLIDVEKAFWVLGGDKMGVMTRNAKWAFEKQEDAEQFIKASGGKQVGFDQIMEAAYEDMYADTKMIRERRKMKKMQHNK